MADSMPLPRPRIQRTRASRQPVTMDLTLDLDPGFRLAGMKEQAASLTIGAVARRAGVAIDTIRFYEREGLLAEPARRASGYRHYDDAAVRQLRFIRRAKALGFTLQEIRDLLALSRERRHGVKAVKQRALERLRSIDARIAELQRVRDGLAELVAACPGRGAPERCPILRALGDDEESA